MQLTVTNTNVSNTITASSVNIGGFAVTNTIAIGNATINTSQIAVGSSYVNTTSVSIPQLTIGGVSWTGGALGSVGGIVNTQIFTANGTWTNPIANSSLGLSGNEQVFIMMWGGGGGSNSTASSRGGGGGACVIGAFNLSSASNTCAVTVGPGGAAATAGASGAAEQARHAARRCVLLLQKEVRGMCGCVAVV